MKKITLPFYSLLLTVTFYTTVANAGYEDCVRDIGQSACSHLSGDDHAACMKKVEEICEYLYPAPPKCDRTGCYG